MAGITHADVDRMFTYHPPLPGQQANFEAITEATKNLAHAIVDNCPPGEEQEEALMLARKTRMMANAAIACATPPANLVG